MKAVVQLEIIYLSHSYWLYTKFDKFLPSPDKWQAQQPKLPSTAHSLPLWKFVKFWLAPQLNNHINCYVSILVNVYEEIKSLM
jgi:hypothetical protein